MLKGIFCQLVEMCFKCIPPWAIRVPWFRKKTLALICHRSIAINCPFQWASLHGKAQSTILIVARISLLRIQLYRGIRDFSHSIRIQYTRDSSMYKRMLHGMRLLYESERQPNHVRQCYIMVRQMVAKWMNSQTKENEDYELIRFELDGVVAQFRLRLGRRVSIFIWVFGAYYAY